jgi:hypothetical protein
MTPLFRLPRLYGYSKKKIRKVFWGAREWRGGVRRGIESEYRERTLPATKKMAKDGDSWAPYRTLGARWLWRAADSAENPNWQLACFEFFLAIGASLISH